jgi:hypothetical protein
MVVDGPRKRGRVLCFLEAVLGIRVRGSTFNMQIGDVP